MSKSLFLTYDLNLKIVSTIGNLIIAKKMFESVFGLPADTNFMGESGRGSLLKKEFLFYLVVIHFSYYDPPENDVAFAMSYRFAFYFQRLPLNQKWHEFLDIFGNDEVIHKQHAEFVKKIAEIDCSDLEMTAEGTFIPGGFKHHGPRFRRLFL